MNRQSWYYDRSNTYRWYARYGHWALWVLYPRRFRDKPNSLVGPRAHVVPLVVTLYL
jgi:hypothetical protein